MYLTTTRLGAKNKANDALAQRRPATASQQATAQDGIATNNSEAPQTQQCLAHAQ
jgi:hypothetical protein